MRVLLVSLSLLLAASCATTPVTDAPTVRLTHLRGPLWVAEDTFFAPENSLVHVGTADVTIVGATWTPHTAALLHERIRAITPLPVARVLLTNYHHDRAGGTAYWRGIGAEVLATEHTARLLALHWDCLVRDIRATYPDYPVLPRAQPTRTIAADERFEGGTIRLLYLGPSHTEDGLFVWFPAQRVLYGGCILKEQLGNVDSANLAEYPRTLRRLVALGLPFDCIVSGHWTPVHGPELIDTYLRLLAEHDTASREAATSPAGARASGADPRRGADDFADTRAPTPHEAATLAPRR